MSAEELEKTQKKGTTYGQEKEPDLAKKAVDDELRHAKREREAEENK